MPKLIFLTALPLWSMGKKQGGPAFTKTVSGYIEKGWDVYLISDESANQSSELLERDHNFLLPPTEFKRYDQIRKLGFVFRILDHKAMTRRFCRKASEILDGLGELGRKDTVIYAYEVFGVEAGKRLAKKYHLPFVTRFQGTTLAPYDDNVLNRLARYPHFEALEQPSDLVIMTDDGTQGDRVLQRLKNNSKTLFFRNGLDLMDRDIPKMYADFDRAAFRSALGVKPEDTVFLTVSRLTGWKKVDRAIRGFADFANAGGGGKLIIVGDGDAKADLEKISQELGIGDRVLFTGAVAHDEVYGYMMASDVFVSLYDLSNVGNPLLEAMTLGKCIITYDVGDTNRIIHDGKNGILLNEKTLPGLGGVMLELSEDTARRDSYGAAAADYAKAHFWTWEERMACEQKEVGALLISSDRQ